MDDQVRLQRRIGEVRKRLHDLRNDLQALANHIELGEWEQAKVHMRTINRKMQKLAAAVEFLEPT